MAGLILQHPPLFEPYPLDRESSSLDHPSPTALTLMRNLIDPARCLSPTTAANPPRWRISSSNARPDGAYLVPIPLMCAINLVAQCRDLAVKPRIHKYDRLTTSDADHPGPAE